MVQDVKPGGVFMINCQWSDEELDQHLNAEAKKYIADNNIQLIHNQRNRQGNRDWYGQTYQHNSYSLHSSNLANVMPIDEAS